MLAPASIDVAARGSSGASATTSRGESGTPSDGNGGTLPRQDHRWFDRALRRSRKREEEDLVLEAARRVKDKYVHGTQLAHAGGGGRRRGGGGTASSRKGSTGGRAKPSAYALSSKPLPAYPEPKRNKVHWDYLMDEMVWLSKEFQKERKWKQSQCRKFARIVERSKLDVESKRIKRKEQEKLAIRKKASQLSQMVMVWWSKVERVVVHKQHYAVEKIEKHRLDKRLDRLVAKTERCSKILASRVSTFMQHQAGTKSESMGHSHPNSQRRVTFDESAMKTADDQMSDVISTSRKLDRIFQDEESDADYHQEVEEAVDDETTMIEEERAAAREGNLLEQKERELNTLQRETDMPIEEVLKRYYDSIDREAAAGDAEQENSAREDSSSQNLTGNASGIANEDDDGHGEIFKEVRNDTEYEMSEDEEDDEQTVAEEERLARKEGNAKRQEALELAALQKESEVPLEQLLAQYREQNSEEKDDDGHGEIFKEVRNDTEYEMSEDEEDDEQTVAEEERLARKEGNAKRQEALELAALQKESEVPLEQLLAQYHVQGEGDEVEEALEEPRTPLTRKRKAESLVSSEGKRQSLEESESDGRELSVDRSDIGEDDEFKPPFLLKYSLREYQLVGLQWLAALRQKSLNGILADEMGLGKTIQTIALLADLACNHGYWGPHLIVVPTSVMLNWEMEFKKWCPAFKILTYYGTAKERQAKRQGWSKFNSFHVCITTYTLILQDKNVFRRKKWDYLILDEAHMIKNWQSQRWQTLLRFNARRRILLTGTPLQNNLMELWSLMHFLMPKIFESHDEFKQWFNNPLTSAVEGQASLSRQLVKRLHGILRPFILRRLKAEVEKALPGKFEHIVYCKLSKRQRNLYEDYVGNSETKNTLASGNYFGIFNVLMQLRKVCNHPDLFEGRAIKSAFDANCISLHYPKLCIMDVNVSQSQSVNLNSIGLVRPSSASLASWDWDFLEKYQTPLESFVEKQAFKDKKYHPKWLNPGGSSPRSVIIKSLLASVGMSQEWRKNRGLFFSALNSVRCRNRPIYMRNLIDCATIQKKEDIVRSWKPLTITLEERSENVSETVENFVFVVPKARAKMPDMWCNHPNWKSRYDVHCPDEFKRAALAVIRNFHKVAIRLRLFFPDRRLVQFDCGKLQQLALLLQKLKAGGHRVLIFTQMSKMLDILESFLNLYSYTYLRLDGATKPEQRQAYTQRFNTDKKIFAFILSTRSGGVGINLTGADTVIFYDSDWNPAMDHQAQDRCHRIGQTREVHIYRLVTKHTVEENIMKKSNQKRHLDHLAIQSGGFNVDFMMSGMNPQALLGGSFEDKDAQMKGGGGMSAKDIRDALNNAEDDADRQAAQVAEKEAEADLAEFVSEGSALEGDLEKKSEKKDEVEKQDVEKNEVESVFGSLQKLLNPVDLYAIRFYESLYPFNAHDFVKVADVEVVREATNDSDHIDEDLDIQEFREEDHMELNVVSEWDPKAAEQAYKEFVHSSII